MSLKRHLAALSAVLLLAALVPTMASSAERPVLFSTVCANKTFKPTRILIACGDASIRWRATN